MLNYLVYVHHYIKNEATPILTLMNELLQNPFSFFYIDVVGWNGTLQDCSQEPLLLLVSDEFSDAGKCGFPQ